MLGQMQDWPLTVSTIIDHAARFHGRRRLIGRDADGAVVASTWSAIREEALKVAAGLRSLGVKKGDRVGVMAWNSLTHLAVWYGVPGAGAVNHTLNPRLFDDQLVYIINHAEDRWIFCDPDLFPIIERLRDRLTTLEGVVVMTDAARMLKSRPSNVICFDDWLNDQPHDQGWAQVEERDACGMCYTSGTTGAPKGVVYSHRSNVLHAMAAVQPDVLGFSANDVVMPVVPLFHANGWSTGYAAPMVGAGMAMPGRDLTPAGLYEMLEQGVTATLGVPTVWLGLLQYLQETGQRLSTLKRVTIGGSACPQKMLETFQDVYGVQVLHAWGMTETSPLGSFATLTPELAKRTSEEKIAAQLKAGRPFYTVDFKIEDDAGKELPRDDASTGRLFIRGPAVLDRYMKAEGPAVDADGWFDTGDVGAMDEHGFIRITDRVKDVIKSGGEWISSIDLENIAIGHPDVAEAAAIGVPHSKWDERPILVVMPAPGRAPDTASILSHVAERVAAWQKPDDVVIVDAIPHTATGKISKRTLRDQLREMGYTHPDERRSVS